MNAKDRLSWKRNAEAFIHSGLKMAECDDDDDDDDDDSIAFGGSVFYTLYHQTHGRGFDPR